MPNTVVKVGVEMSKNVDAEPMLPSQYTPSDQIIYEYFKKGTEPTTVSPYYKRLPEVTGLKCNYDASTKTVRLTWNPSSPEDPITEYGAYGYRTYKGKDYIKFVETNSLVLTNVDNPNGTYRVASAYGNTAAIDSLGVTCTIDYQDPADYEATLKVNANKQYHINEALDSHDSNPSANDIKFTKDGEVVTPSVKVSIKDKNGNTIANITTTSANEYTITYTVSYSTYSKTLTRKVTIIDNTEPETSEP